MLTIDFTGQTVVVIGGTSGINRGIAEAFARHGARVAVASRTSQKVADTVAALQHLGAEAMGFVADVRDYDAVVAGFAEVAAAFGAIDVLVSGAAGNFPALAENMSPNGFKSVVDIDLLGTYHVLRAAHPHLRRPGGSVINISAPQAVLGMVGQAHVCAAKAGVDMITRTLALEWGPEGIRLNSVIPGPIEGTEGMRRLAPTPEIHEACRKSVPMRRMGVPDDVANACLFLASPLAAYVHGVVLPVDGGWLLGGYTAVGAAMEPLLRAMPARDKP
ncbi:MAG: SDR family oxidoreductase [Cellvibrionaceae bacterium]|nr:SDR family oxidoreductase [Cellvibrionaceae bacterium]